MAAVIHRDPQLRKCLIKLLRAGGRAALAAQRAEAILSTLATDASLRPEEVHKLTRRGEARIDKCRKFDLVGGYRLIYVKEEHHYFFLFAGTHDECDRWLEHHRDRKPEMQSPDTAGQVGQPARAALVEGQEAPVYESDYDALLMQNIDEKMLRRVFRGLCGK